MAGLWAYRPRIYFSLSMPVAPRPVGISSVNPLRSRVHYVNVPLSKQIDYCSYASAQFLTDDEMEQIVHDKYVLQKLLTKVHC